MSKVLYFYSDSEIQDLLYQTPGSVGIDLRSVENVTINPKEFSLVKTGLYLQLPEGIEAQIRSRSGLAAKNGVFVLNGVGTLDCDYRGEVGVILANFGKDAFKINPGDRIAQIVFNEITKPILTKLPSRDLLSETSRASSGFGSTGLS